jgi:hypothetical protein
LCNRPVRTGTVDRSGYKASQGRQESAADCSARVGLEPCSDVGQFRDANAEALERSRHARVQHVAFEYETLDDLLCNHVRLKNLPVWAADQAFQTPFYYQDPDQNILKFNVDNFEDVWTATEQYFAFSNAGLCRSGEDDHGAQGRRITLGRARARLRRRVRSNKAVRFARNLLNGIIRPQNTNLCERGSHITESLFGALFVAGTVTLRGGIPDTGRSIETNAEVFKSKVKR